MKTVIFKFQNKYSNFISYGKFEKFKLLQLFHVISFTHSFIHKKSPSPFPYRSFKKFPIKFKNQSLIFYFPSKYFSRIYPYLYINNTEIKSIYVVYLSLILFLSPLSDFLLSPFNNVSYLINNSIVNIFIGCQ